MKGYKVTWGVEPTSFSAPTDGAVVYSIGEVTKPRYGCGPFAVFQTEDDANKFLEEPQGRLIQIYECEYEPSDEDRLYTPSKKWCAVPEGTAFAKSVTLTL